MVVVVFVEVVVCASERASGARGGGGGGGLKLVFTTRTRVGRIWSPLSCPQCVERRKGEDGRSSGGDVTVQAFGRPGWRSSAGGSTGAAGRAFFTPCSPRCCCRTASCPRLPSSRFASPPRCRDVIGYTAGPQGIRAPRADAQSRGRRYGRTGGPRPFGHP